MCVDCVNLYFTMFTFLADLYIDANSIGNKEKQPTQHWATWFTLKTGPSFAIIAMLHTSFQVPRSKDSFPLET